MSLALAAEPRCCPPSAFVASTPCAARMGEFTFEHVLRHAGVQRVTLRYELVGPHDAPVVFVAGGISAGRHLAAHAADPTRGWWEAQVGEGRALDPTRRRLLSFDWLGADAALDVVIDPADQADAIAALLDRLRIDALQGFVGCSYGAMVGLQFASRHGRRLGHLVAISGTHRAHPYASAWRALQRQAVTLGALQCDEAHGLSLARQLAVLSYRTPEEFAQRFSQARVRDGRVRVDAEPYLAHHGARYVATTSAIAFLRLSESIDLQQVEPETIDVPVTVVAITEDSLVPVEGAYVLAERLRGSTRLCVLRSAFGHDAFLKEDEAIANVLRDALALEVAA